MPTVHLSFGRGLFNFEAATTWTVENLRNAVESERDINVPLSERPRPASTWQSAFVANKDFGFVLHYHGYDMSGYQQQELLSDDTELEDGSRVYLVMMNPPFM